MVSEEAMKTMAVIVLIINKRQGQGHVASSVGFKKMLLESTTLGLGQKVMKMDMHPPFNAPSCRLTVRL